MAMFFEHYCASLDCRGLRIDEPGMRSLYQRNQLTFKLY